MIGVIEDFASRQVGGGALAVTRAVTANPAYVNGYPAADASTSTFTIIAQVVPANGRDIKILQDQAIVGESRSLLTATALTPRDKTHEGDRLTGVDLDPTSDGSVWVCVFSEHFTAPDGETHYHALVAKDATQ